MNQTFEILSIKSIVEVIGVWGIKPVMSNAEIHIRPALKGLRILGGLSLFSSSLLMLEKTPL